jgi:hypothetical protein
VSNDFEFSSAAETKQKRGAAMSSTRQQTSAPQATLPKEVVEETPEVETAGEEKKEKPQYNPEELARIFDEVVFSGEYSEDITIKGKLKIRLRTRNAEEIEQISLMIDGTTAQLVATLAEKRSILSLQYALETYAGKDLRVLSLADRAKFIKNLAGPIIGALLTALNKFDEKVYAACQDGEENF